MPNAIENFDLMLRTVIAPRLRELGWKGSGKAYQWPHPDYYRFIDFQKSAWGSRDEVVFYVNLEVVSCQEFETFVQGHPGINPKPTAATVHWAGQKARLDDDFGNPSGQFEVHADTDISHLGSHVVSLIRDRVMPVIYEPSRPKLASAGFGGIPWQPDN
jgi:hypothetical protein